MVDFLQSSIRFSRGPPLCLCLSATVCLCGCKWKKDSTQRISDCVRHKHRGGGGDPGVKKTGRKSHEPFKRVGGRGGSDKHGEGQRGVCSKIRSFHSCFSPSVWRRCLQTSSAPVQVWITTSRPLQAKQTEWKWNQSGRESLPRENE